jgi:DNA-binding transcriptional regulator YhcF (GntR family)
MTPAGPGNGGFMKTVAPPANRGIVPRYHVLKLKILDTIMRGIYKPYQKLPSINDMMNLHSVSSITASRVIRELLNDDRVYTIHGKGCFVKTPRAGNPLQAVRPVSNRIVLIADAYRYNYYMPMLKGILDETQNKGYELSLVDTSGKLRMETSLLRYCMESPPAGVLFVPSFTGKQYSHVLALEKRSIPVTVIEPNVPGGKSAYLHGNKSAMVLTGRISALRGGTAEPVAARHEIKTPAYHAFLASSYANY